MQAIILLSAVSRVLESQAVLNGVSLCVAPHQTCAITGASGSGKSTLLNIIGLLDKPCAGRLVLNGIDVGRASDDQRAVLRNRLMGFVFQSSNLLPRLTVLDNVALPLNYRGVPLSIARRAAYVQLEKVAMLPWACYRPADLSGGQRQRVAIARALVTSPQILLADEPTGNLDNDTATNIMNLLLALNREQGMTMLIATHDLRLASCMDRCLQVHEGSVFDA